MAKFNEKATIKTTNKSGHVAYNMKDKEKLVSMVLTTFFGEPKYYGDNSNDLVKLATHVAQNEPKFVSNLAVYARKVYHLRSVAHVLTCIVAHENESKQYIKRTLTGVVERADDLTEILACYISMYGKPIPNGLKKALASNIKKFDEYSLAKYNGGKKSFTFKDILKLTHVKPSNDEQSKLFKKVLEDNLETPITWETELSAKGNKKEVWEELIESNKLGYMAMLRNLRNILNVQPDNIDKVYAKLSDEKEVARSKQLPFRFFSAYREIKGNANCSSKTLDVLEDALSHSVVNLPKLNGKTAIFIDSSSSMTSYISKNSSVECYDIAKLLGVLAARICDDCMVFTFHSGNSWYSNLNNSTEKIDISGRDGILSQANSKFRCAGGGTSMEDPFKHIIDKKLKFDRVIILSDNETNGYGKSTIQSYADKYRNALNTNLWVHAIDLQGYGTQQFCGKNTNFIAGWGERVLEFINLAEEGISTQVKDIERFEY